MFVTQLSQKLANALHTQPEAASLPPVQYHNHDTPENGNKTLPSAQEAGKTHTAGLQTSRISPRFRYTPLLNNLDHDLALGNAETEDWSGGKQSFRGGETMGLEQMSLPRDPPVAPPPALRSRPPTLGFFPPDHRSPSIRWSRMTVCPSSVAFTHRTPEVVTGGRGVYTQRSVAKGRTRGREGTPVARDRDTGRAGSMGTPPGPSRWL